MTMGFSWLCAQPNHKHEKLGPRVAKIVFISYLAHSKGYVVYGKHPNGGMIEIESPNINFLEDEFPSISSNQKGSQVV